MRLTAFQSGKGDCLLLTNTAGTARMLVDGGMPASYSASCRPRRSASCARARRRTLDLVYVSHIDQDHIGGVLRMLDDEAAVARARVPEEERQHAHKAPRGAASAEDRRDLAQRVSRNS